MWVADNVFLTALAPQGVCFGKNKTGVLGVENQRTRAKSGSGTKVALEPAW